MKMLTGYLRPSRGGAFIAGIDVGEDPLTAQGKLGYLPESAPRILEALNQPGDLAWSGVGPGQAVPTEGIEPADPLFPRVESPTAAA